MKKRYYILMKIRDKDTAKIRYDVFSREISNPTIPDEQDDNPNVIAQAINFLVSLAVKEYLKPYEMVAMARNITKEDFEKYAIVLHKEILMALTKYNVYAILKVYNDAQSHRLVDENCAFIEIKKHPDLPEGVSEDENIISVFDAIAVTQKKLVAASTKTPEEQLSCEYDFCSQEDFLDFKTTHTKRQIEQGGSISDGFDFKL